VDPVSVPPRGSRDSANAGAPPERADASVVGADVPKGGAALSKGCVERSNGGAGTPALGGEVNHQIAKIARPITVANPKAVKTREEGAAGRGLANFRHTGQSAGRRSNLLITRLNLRVHSLYASIHRQHVS